MENQEITHHQLGHEQEDSQTRVEPTRYTSHRKVSWKISFKTSFVRYMNYV